MTELKFTPDADPLTKDQVKTASKILLKKNYVKLEFPRVNKLRRDPRLDRQEIFLFTFIPSAQASADKDGVFGCIKMRGNFPSVEEADEYAEKLLVNDSYNEILYGRVGVEMPLSLDPNYCENTKEIDIRARQDAIARSFLKKKRDEENKEKEEIMDRQKALLEDTKETKEKTYDDLEFYTTLKTKYANVRYMLDEHDKKKVELETIRDKSRAEIVALDKSYPDYSKSYKKKYEDACKASGIDLKSNPLVKYME